MTKFTPAPVTETVLNGFVGAVQQLHDDYIAKHHAGYPFKTTIEFERGKKNIRIVKTERNQEGEVIGRSVHCFVEVETGTILKAGGWKAPVKGSRGNIHAENFGSEYVTWHGVHYLR